MKYQAYIHEKSDYIVIRVTKHKDKYCAGTNSEFIYDTFEKWLNHRYKNAWDSAYKKTWEEAQSDLDIFATEHNLIKYDTNATSGMSSDERITMPIRMVKQLRTD